jgi:hypothetical protein
MAICTDRPGPATALTALVLCLGLAASPAGQSVTGVVPNWSDLETWSRPIPGAREVEHGVGLHVSGPGGTMLLSFSGRLSLRTLRPPASLLVVLAPPLLSNPNVIRKPTLIFVADDGTKEREVIDATASVRVDDPAPGAIVRSATGRVSAPSFLRLTEAKMIAGEVFGAEVAFRPDQMKALQDLAAKLKLK